MKHLETVIEDHNTSERICACCGMVLERITKERGIITHDNENKIHWNTTTLSHHDGAMGSVAKGYNSAKINMWQSRLRISDSMDARNSANFMILQKIFDLANTPKFIQNIAYHLSQKATKKMLDIGIQRDSFQKAILYFAYEISGNKYLRKQFLSDYNITNKRIFNKCVWQLKQEFHIVTDYVEFTEKIVYKYAANMRFTKKEIDLALSIISYAQKKNLTSGKDPNVVAGTALYISYYSLHKYYPNTVNDIAEKCNVHLERIQDLKRQWHEILDILKLRHNVLWYSKIKHI